MATLNYNNNRVFIPLFRVLCVVLFISLSSGTNTKKIRDVTDRNQGKLSLHNIGEKDEKLAKLFDDEYYTDTRQENVSPKVLGGIDIANEAVKISMQLLWITNQEIGVTDMQTIYDNLKYEEEQFNPQKKLDYITDRLAGRFKNYLQVLNTNKITVQNLYKFHVKQPITKKLSCCHLPPMEFSEESQYGCKISKRTSCDLYPENLPRGAFNPGRNLTEVWKSNMQYFDSLKWQYFISVDGIHTEYPANAFHGEHRCTNVHDHRHRTVFVSTVQPQPKHIVIVMDHGNSLSANQLRTAKGIAKHLLNSLSEKDRVGVVGLASRPTFSRAPSDDTCIHSSMVPVTFEATLYFSKFIDNLEKEDASTNHSLGFQVAFDIIENMVKKTKGAKIEQAMIIYISRGLLSSLTEAKDVMDVISQRNGGLGHRVIINTYAVIDDGKPIMYEKSFLQDIADQNFQKYNVRIRSPNKVVPGVMMAINSTKDLSSSVGRFYLPFNRTTNHHVRYSLPYIDKADSALTLTISQTCFHDNQVIGVTGVDLHMEDIVQDMTYLDGEQAYLFLINTEGYTLMHPSFSRPIKTHLQPMHTDIWHFENMDGFVKIRSDMLNKERGEEVLMIQRKVTPANSSDPVVTVPEFYARYIWRRVEDTPFILALKTVSERKNNRKLVNIPVSKEPELVYHRLDLVPKNKMCLHLKQLATPEVSSVFLSATSFSEPYTYLSKEETKRMVQSYLLYLSDSLELLTNPGLNDDVRDDVTATGRINAEWLRRSYTSNLNDYIIRRYIATRSGVFRMLPGTLMEKTFDPTKRSWYQRAMQYPDQVTLTSPYLDVGGAGYITTISHTVFEGKRAPHSTTDPVVGVMGMDITLGYFYKLLVENIPMCQHPTVKCFVMDDTGYLIAHPALIEPNGKGPVEQQHITHQEPLVANDILNHEHFVRKELCNRYNDRTVQRFYKFNTSLEGVLTNRVHGEHCARYQITHIPGTNAFIAIVNHTCDTATAFCPCSMFDRLCLNCNRMEQIECECPCECPLAMNFCTGALLKEEDMNPSCPRYPEPEMLFPLDNELMENLEPCRRPLCSERTSKMTCIGVMGCQWCQVAEDGLTPLKGPYCADQRVCFGGIEGAQTPYGDQIKALLYTDPPPQVKSAPVGPVAGGIMGCFLVLALGVYCYRHHIHRDSHQYITSLPDNPNRMSQYYEAEEVEPTDDPGSGHTNFVLATFDNAASVSPYRVNTSYRRPAGGDSDHGYSTMTPHEDSEHASLPCLEPLIIGKDRYRPGPYSVVAKNPILPPPPSNYRRSRSPTPPLTRLSGCHQSIPEQTCIPQTIINTPIPELPNNIIANVQVHMVDTH
ncbi:VWFA and cache domain-containing protein 1-like [Ylistrum balloti]|uniref:VWFA and cache domain-containing protein 1-like n=1 Tax=Ylistrum balloti TaxID=509963 RepID=UPI002905A3FA|nr:VWFA and cache domain-containing protein 1-like [Ylistrum balloti]